jgi:hypothetical protein
LDELQRLSDTKAAVGSDQPVAGQQVVVKLINEAGITQRLASGRQ